MPTKYTRAQKQGAIDRYFAGEEVRMISRDTGISRSTLYSWIKAERMRLKKGDDQGVLTVKKYNQLAEHSRRLEGMLEILKTCECAPHDPLPRRLEVLEELYYQDKYSVRMLCEALDVPRGTFYNHIFRNKREESSYEKRREELRIRIQKIYDDSHQIYGAPKIAAVLQAQGVKVTKEMVRRLMREMGLESIRYGAKKRYTDESRKTQNLLNRNFNVDRPNQIWVSDVTYFRLKDLGYYICVVMDLYARKIIAYRIGNSNSTQLVKSTFRDAYESRDVGPGLMFHTDQGGNYRSRAFRTFLKERGVEQSFSKTGTPYDNAVMESFFAILKREELYRRKYRSEREFRDSIASFMKFYNAERPHKANRYRTPDKAEQDFWERTRDGGEDQPD